MQLHPGRGLSWSMAEDVPEDLHAALFARDAFALARPGVRLPTPLEPAVPDLRGTLELSPDDQEAAARDWPAWWRALVAAHRLGPAHRELGLDPVFELYDPPGFRSLAATPALRAVVAASDGPFRSWWSGDLGQPRPPGPGFGIPGQAGALIDRLHATGMLANEVVAEVERRLGRPVRPFHLAIDHLAVSGYDAWPVDDGYALASLRLREHRPAFTDWLHPLVLRLA